MTVPNAPRAAHLLAQCSRYHPFLDKYLKYVQNEIILTAITQPEAIMLAAARHEPTSNPSPALSGAAVRAFLNIADLWHLDVEAQLTLLGDPPRSTFYKWKKQPDSAHLGRDTLERISYLLGIYKALQILLPDPAAADAWIKKANSAPLFGGKSALDRMLSGNVGDLFVVRQYLDAMRGSW
jgi:hypothetical protein